MTPSPAIDRSARVGRIAFDRVLRPAEMTVLPGGKGINVARAAQALGALVATTGFAGGHSGRWLVESLAAEGLNPRFVTTATETRTTYVVVDDRGRSVLIYEPAGPLEAGDAEQLAFLLQSELLPVADFVVIAGSLPLGMEPTIAGELVRRCHAADRPCLVDLTGPELLAALAARPQVAKLSLEEAMGSGIASGRGAGTAGVAAAELVRRGAAQAIVTDGPRGAAGCDGGALFEVSVPPVSAVSAIGSGDAVSAGVAIALAVGRPFAEALAMGAAAGTANARSLGAGRLDPTEYEAILAEVVVRRPRAPVPGRVQPAAASQGARRGPA